MEVKDLAKAAQAKKARRSGKTDPAAERATILEAFEVRGETGMALAAPQALQTLVTAYRYTKDGELSAKDRERLFGSLQIDRFLEPAGDIEHSLPPARKAGSPRTVRVALFRIAPAGREELARRREEERQVREAELERQARSAEGLREAVATHARAIEDLRSELALVISPPGPDPADRLSTLAADLEEALRRMRSAIERDSAERRARAETVFRQLEGALENGRVLSRIAAAAILAPPGNHRDTVLQEIPAEGWIDIPRLHEALRIRGAVLRPGELRDALLDLHRDQLITLGAWNRSLADLPAPEHAILGEGARVFYQVKRI